MRGLAVIGFCCVGMALAGDLPRTAAPEGAAVYILRPADGEVVTSPVRVVFGLQKMGVAPAGINAKGTGHHHLLIDTPLPDLDKPIPADAKHLHFGGGQTEAVIELEPGEHTLQLLLGDANHIPHQPPVMSNPITIVVTP
ncbi:MAG: DUF4399 domain-containing protein [Gammaproteobacteria bacterium]|nr:DUF4399 domain-containing protein [Gammaproteobacteria bacterium]